MPTASETSDPNGRMHAYNALSAPGREPSQCRCGEPNWNENGALSSG